MEYDNAIPENSLLLGPCRVALQENADIRIRLIDIGSPAIEKMAALPQIVLAELTANQPHPVVALRGRRRWIPNYSRAMLPESTSSTSLRDAGVYVLFGGTGEVGIAVAQALFRDKRARLVLVSRQGVSSPTDLAPLANEPTQTAHSSQIRALNELRLQGAEILVLQADVSRHESVRSVIETVLKHFGAVHGIFHLVGPTGEGVVHLLTDTKPSEVERITAAKVHGVRAIEQAISGCNPDFVVLFSSTATVLGGVGLSSYAAANAVLEAASATKQRSGCGTRWISLAWDAWLTDRYITHSPLPPALREYALDTESAIKALFEVLESGVDGPLIVSSGNLSARYRNSMRPAPRGGKEGMTSSRSERDPVRAQVSPYVAPLNKLEQAIATAWQEYLGVERVGREDKFFELGGNSLLALRIVSRLKRELGREISVISVFEGVTVRGMAELLT